MSIEMPANTRPVECDDTALLVQLHTLTKRFSDLEGIIEEDLLDPVRRKARPTDRIVAAISELIKEFDDVLSASRRMIPDLTDKLSVNAIISQVESSAHSRAREAFHNASLSTLKSVLQIGLATGEKSPALDKLHCHALDLMSEMNNSSLPLDEYKEKMSPFHDLLRLLIETSLSEEESETLACRVEKAFGRSIIRPHFFRQLLVKEPDLCPAVASLDGLVEQIQPLVRCNAVIAQGLVDNSELFDKASLDTNSLALGKVCESDNTTSTECPVSLLPVELTSLSVNPPIVAFNGGPVEKIEVDATTTCSVDFAGATKAATGMSSDIATVVEGEPASHPQTAGREAPIDVSGIPPLPEELHTFETFAAHFWIHPLTGHCQQSPWRSPDFVSQVDAATSNALRLVAEGNSAKLVEAYLFATALAELNHVAIRAETIRDYAAVHAEPTKLSVGRNPERACILGNTSSLVELQLGLAIEAVRPTHAAIPYGDELAQLIDRAQFRESRLREVIDGLLRHCTVSDAEPTAQIRAALSKQPPPIIDWAAEFLQRRRLVQDEVKRVTLNAGSSYVGQFRHCRLAWNQFMTDSVLPLASQMYPEISAKWDAAEMDRRIGQLTRAHSKVADAHEARLKARKTMDRAVERLTEVLTDANDVYRELSKAPARDRQPSNELVGQVRRLIEDVRPVSPSEFLAHSLLVRVLAPNQKHSEQNVLCVNSTFFASYPSLLDCLVSPILATEPCSIDRITGYAPLIAATLLCPQVLPSGEMGWSEVDARCREERSYERIRARCGELSPNDQIAATLEKSKVLVERHRRIERLRTIWRGLESLRVESHKTNRSIVSWAASHQADSNNPKLIEAWLESVTIESKKQLSVAVSAWKRALSIDPQDKLRLVALEQGRYDLAIRGTDAAGYDSRPLRETPWRSDAATKFTNPRLVLIDQATSSRLAEKWTGDFSERSKRTNALSSMRSEFTKWVFVEELLSVAEKASNRFVIATEHIRRHLSALQPSYLPQLHAAQHMVVICAPEAPSDRDYTRRLITAVEEHRENTIVVVLCPGMTLTIREEVRRQLHTRNLFAGTVDDLDLCRLLNPGGGAPNPIVGLFEIILEQQPWKARNPFASPEGSEMRLEMYVGRREEAEQLATTGAKTRLFSGRKLGKTALLQFIRQTWDGRTLPNGRRLRVVYVSIVGVSREDLFAKKVSEQLRLDFPEVRLVDSIASPDALLSDLRSVLAHRTEEELLIVLDEADEFVIAQLREYDRIKESCLSFRLREPLSVGGGGSRVRYVFTGYRATATREGAWLNWGDVLELSQLNPEEAAGLIARPLARMGIDCSEQAEEVAFRCGYQPAVLLRFGERLVERMAEDIFREGAKITHELVQDTFEDAKVQAEIQGVVRANFQGNPLGQAVFAAVLQETARSPLGYWLGGLDQIVADIFREAIKFRTDMDPAAEQDFPTAIPMQLRDMHLRKLLLRRYVDGQPVYQLRFPHHLATLLTDLDVSTEILANLRAWKETHSVSGESGSARGRSPLHSRDLANLRDMLRPEMADFNPTIVAVGSLWPASLIHEPGGVPDRLELPPQTPLASDYRPDSIHVCWKQAKLSDLDRVLANPPSKRPTILLGEIDLIRGAIARRNQGNSAVEPFGTYRMSDGQVRWWFQRIIGIEFASESTYQDVHKKTEGVPLFVDQFQRILLPAGPPSGGANLSREVVDAAFATFEQSLVDPKTAEHLARRLTDREKSILRMAHTIAVMLGVNRSSIGDFLAGGWTETDFGPPWVELYSDRPFPPAYLSEPEDATALDTLLSVGLLPASNEPGNPMDRVWPLPSDDPVAKLLRQFR